MAIKTFTSGEVLTASDTNTYLANSGLVFVTSQSLGSSPIVVANCFSSVYDNYRIVISALPSTTILVSLRIRDSGGEVSLGNYNQSVVRTDSSTASTYVNEFFGRSLTSCSLINTSTQWGMELDITSPNLAEPTTFVGKATNAVSNNYSIAGSYNANTVATGFNLILSTGSLTGDISVYGYRTS